jgi:maltose/maltodextrin transport system substrate-binding protein
MSVAMSRFFLACAIGAAAVQAIPARAVDNGRDNSQYRLLVWINGDKAYNGLQKVGDAFTRVSGVPVLVQHPEDAPGKFQQAVGAGKGPDIFCWPHNLVGEWAKSGLIVPVQPRPRLREQIEPSAWKAFDFDGRTWGYPLAIEAVGLIYNKALVKTPPKTFDEVVALDRLLMVQGRKAILWDYRVSFFTWPLMAGAGGFIFAPTAAGGLDTRQVGVNAPGVVRVAEQLDGWIRSGLLPRGAGYSQMEAGFNQGRVAMMVSGPWAWDNLRKSGIDFGVTTLPSVLGYRPKTFVGVLGCMISAASPVKDIAREFIENHLLRIASLKVLDADVPIGTPANKAFYAERAADPNIRATMENARLGEPVPNVPEISRFWPAMDAALQAITNGQQSPQDALDGAAARMLIK